MKIVLIGILLWICGGFTLAFGGALLAHKQSWRFLSILLLLILAASVVI